MQSKLVLGVAEIAAARHPSPVEEVVALLAIVPSPVLVVLMSGGCCGGDRQKTPDGHLNCKNADAGPCSLHRKKSSGIRALCDPTRCFPIHL